MPEIGKKLSELRVCDLKDELEKRDLDTVGSKAALLERLQTALKGEGIDPNTYVYQPAGKSVKKSLTKPVEEVLVKEEPIDYDTSAVDDEEANGDYRHGDNDHLIDEVGTVDDECVIIEDDDEYYDNGDEQAAEEDEEEVEAEAEAEDEEVEDEENTGDGTNQDNEESINLTIGEEEQKLLHDEAPDDKERSAADEQAKAVRKESNGKADEDKSEHSGKDDKKEGKDDEGSKIKSKKDEQSNDKKDDSSDQKSSSKTSHKDEKEKSAAVTSNAVATNAAGEVSKSTTGAKSASLSRNLWVSGLSSLTRASDLKTIFSKYGKVIGAKVVTNTRTPGTRCYGYVTMSSSGDASRCIEHLHRTELHGRIISVERTKNEIGGSASSAANAGNRSANNTNSGSKKRDDDKRTSKTSGDDKKKTEDKKTSTHGSKKDDRKDDKSKKDEKDKENKTDSKEAGKDKDDKDREVASTGKRHSRRGSRSVDGARPDRSRDHDREREQRQKERERERERIRQREILSYQKIREERERQRLREKERELREEERRRREIRERQRQEEQRLADERKKLAVERERLEKEKAELLRLERERQKLEREKIELERLELKRQQMKIIQSRDDPIKRTVKRAAAEDRYAEVPERKRTSGNENRFEAPPPPRFDAALVSSRSYDKKREDYTGSTSTKRGIDDYTSKRSDYASKRDEYTSSTTKRAAVDDYAPAPPKRSTEEYSKRTTSDYIASSGSKRGIDDYSSSNKRDDYSSSKLQRDEYKREVEIRHITASGTSGGGSSYMHKSSGSRYAEPDVQVRSSVTSFRRVDDRGDTRSGTGGKRYDGSGGYGSSSNGAWAPSSSSHLGHVSGVPTIKSYVSNGMSSNVHSGSAAWQKSSAATESNWRSMTSSQDRYDRTYNERSGAYVDSSRPSGGGLYGSGRPTSDRYGGAVSSRYDGKY